jgi:hypothetical protein
MKFMGKDVNYAKTKKACYFPLYFIVIEIISANKSAQLFQKFREAHFSLRQDYA